MKENLFKAKVTEHGLTCKALAEEMSLNPKTFYRKMKNNSFTMSQAAWLADRLDVKASKDIVDIFLR